jgi:glycosyltransferase involved in cell wall biosynthesis
MRDSAEAIADSGIALPTKHSHAFNVRRLAREKAEYDSATAVLVPSAYAKKEFIGQGFPEARLLQHRYGCDLDRFPERIHPRAEGPLRAVFLGRGDPTKGLHIALQAWRKAAIPGASLTVAGRLQPDYAASLKDDLRLPGVSIAGFVDDVPALLGQADVMLLPTWTEGSALVTLEAQASGCVPMISTAAGALGVDGVDFVEHPVGDAGALADQLVRLANRSQELDRMSRQGTARRQFLSWQAAAEALVGCYGIAMNR